MLLGGLSAWAQSQLKDSTDSLGGGGEIDLVEVTHKNKPPCGLLPYLLGSCFKLGLLHVATLQLHHSHAWPLILTLKCTHSFSKCFFFLSYKQGMMFHRLLVLKEKMEVCGKSDSKRRKAAKYV